jgi:DNA-binding NarL/FixJ family response regulator
MDDIKEHTPDIYLIDYKLPGSKNGIDAAIEILTEFPSAPILFVTADERTARIISKNPLLTNNRVTVVLKPIKLDKLEKTMLQLVNKK